MKNVASPEAEQSLWRGLLRTDPLDVVPRLSLLLVIPVEATTPIMLLGLVGVAVATVFPRVYRNPFLWLALFAVRGIDQYLNWYGVDDHLVLITYWCLAVGLAFMTSDPGRSLALSGRLLVGLTMAWAVIHKLASVEFVDGTFMHFTLLVDPRFELATQWAGGMSSEMYESNRATWFDTHTFASPVGVLEATGRVTTLAWGLTVGSVVVESALAAAFLAPDRSWRRLPTVRLVLLLAFITLTYVIVPVSYFGLVLIAMAIASDHARPERIRWYLGAVAALILWPPIWEWLSALAAS